MIKISDIPVTGVLLVNKPVGPTSYDIIRWIKRTGLKTKIGHCGTLDPMASGLLIILLGRATKRQSEIMGQPKTYRFEMKLGLKTDTGDVTGTITDRSSVPALTDELIKETLKKFLGKQQQVPPMFSALKHQGVPLYKLARKGQVIKREPREIEIFNLDFLERRDSDHLGLRMTCSSGTYVRVFVENLASAWSTLATLSSLVREKIGDYELTDSIGGEEIKKWGEQDIRSRLIMPRR